MPERTGPRLTGFYLAALIVTLSVLLQATLLPRIRFFGSEANLVLVVVISWSLLSSIQEGMLWAFFAGLCIDLVAGMPLGTSSLAMMTVCLLVVLGEGSFFQGHIFLPMIAIGLATPLYAWIILLTQQLRGLAVDWPGTTLHVIIPELLLNIVLVSLIYPLLRRLAARLGVSRAGW